MTPLATLAHRYRDAFTTAPRRADWMLAGALLPLFALATGALGFATGLLHITPPHRDWPLIVLVSLFIPALAEETLFRAYLPSWRETRRPLAWIAASTLVFVVWHLVQPLVLTDFAPFFWRADFLAISAILGIVCATLRMRSGSLWPGVIFHWIVVGGWLTLLGGPRPGDIL